jgi:cell wall-associated NlpC family hydrolase
VTDPRIKSFLDIALDQLGKPYVWGAEGPNSFDCSGFVYYCLKKSGYDDLDRWTADMYSRDKKWTYVDKDDLQPGDLMFYYSDNKDDGDHIGHIGIYLGNGYHIHASSDYGCIIISGVDGWYKKALSHGRRVFE